MPAAGYLEEISLAAKRSAGVTPEVNLREHVAHTPLPNTNKAARSDFASKRRHHQKSKTGGMSGPTKGLMSCKKFEPKNNAVAVAVSHW